MHVNGVLVALIRGSARNSPPPRDAIGGACGLTLTRDIKAFVFKVMVFDKLGIRAAASAKKPIDLMALSGFVTFVGITCQSSGPVSPCMSIFQCLRTLVADPNRLGNRYSWPM